MLTTRSPRVVRVDEPGTDVTSPYDLAAQAAEKLAELTGVDRHDVALVLGSGWLPAAEMLGETVAEVATTDLPGFSAAAVAARLKTRFAHRRVARRSH